MSGFYRSCLPYLIGESGPCDIVKRNLEGRGGYVAYLLRAKFPKGKLRTVRQHLTRINILYKGPRTRHECFVEPEMRNILMISIRISFSSFANENV